jgi:DNA-binding transcriptional MerR regulator/methylmalonyl-CoA mutase cobalamin-binding subunit
MLYEGGVSDPATPPDDVELSIGALSAATGVPVDTLRTWERRYGFPAPVGRTEGSHRRYAAETIAQVRLILEALAHGHRPSAVVGRTTGEIRRLMSLVARPTSEGDAVREQATLERWLSLTRELDAPGLAVELEVGLASMAVIPFLERCLGPYLFELGERWARGELRILHEHFASERTREFLSAHWRALAEGIPAPAPRVVLANPPGERHVLGLHMAAWVMSLSGVRAIFLGADTPMSEVIYAAERHDACGVVLSVAAGYDGDLPGHLTALSHALPRGVDLRVGGTGAAKAGANEYILNSFLELAQWCGVLAAKTR